MIAACSGATRNTWHTFLLKRYVKHILYNFYLVKCSHFISWHLWCIALTYLIKLHWHLLRKHFTLSLYEVLTDVCLPGIWLPGTWLPGIYLTRYLLYQGRVNIHSTVAGYSCIFNYNSKTSLNMFLVMIDLPTIDMKTVIMVTVIRAVCA